jgi:O-antigen/teichoic acid export membrane protein
MNNRLVGEFFWVAFGQISSMILGLMFIRMLTENLNPAEYGQLSLVLTLGVLVCVVPSAYFIAGIERMYSMAVEQKQEYEYYTAIKKMARKSGLLSLIILVIMLVILKTQYPLYWEWREAVFLATLFTIISGYSTALTSIFNAARERTLVAFYIFIDALLKIVVISILAYGNLVDVYVVLFMYVILSAVTMFMRYRTFLKKISKPLLGKDISSSQWQQKMYKYSMPFVYFQLFAWMHTSSDKWALEMYSSTEETGLLVVLMQIGYAPTIIFSGMMITFISPILYQLSGSGKIKENKIAAHNLSIKISTYILLVTVMATLIAYTFHDLMFEIMTNEQYHSVSYLMPWVVLSAGLFSIGQMLSTKLSSELRIKELVKPKIITALIGVVFNIIGAYFLGIEGVVMSLVMFSMFYAVWMFYLSSYSRSINSVHDF